MMAKSVVVVLCLLTAGACATPTLQAQILTGPDVVALPVAGFEDHVVPIGHVDGGVLRVTLDAGPAQWRPWGEDGPSILAHAFAADGGPPRVPGPLLRVSAGTPVHVTVRNTFDRPLVVYGLQDRTPGADGAPPPRDSVLVAPGGSAKVHFTPRTPGTFIYPAQVVGIGGVTPGQLGGGPNRPFVGVMIVDPGGETPPPGERILILNHWAIPDLPASFLPATRFFINGRSWPHTERLEYQQGDTVRWRVINVTGRRTRCTCTASTSALTRAAASAGRGLRAGRTAYGRDGSPASGGDHAHDLGAHGAG
jgi:manganese oxidase